MYSSIELYHFTAAVAASVPVKFPGMDEFLVTTLKLFWCDRSCNSIGTKHLSRLGQQNRNCLGIRTVQGSFLFNIKCFGKFWYHWFLNSNTYYLIGSSSNYSIWTIQEWNRIVMVIHVLYKKTSKCNLLMIFCIYELLQNLWKISRLISDNPSQSGK